MSGIGTIICIAWITAAVIAVGTSQFVPDNLDDPANQISHKMHVEIEDKVNNQVSRELEASLQYMTMSSFFASEERNRPGFANYFKKASQEEWEHSHKFVEYLAKRGTQLKSLSVQINDTFSWPNGKDALRDAAQLESYVTATLSDIHFMATTKKDAHLTDFLDSKFFPEQIDSMRELSGYMNNLEVMMHNSGDEKHQKHNAFAEYLFDVQLQKKKR